MPRIRPAELRARWFDTGAEALTRFTNGSVTNHYRCPLCLRDFTRNGAISGDTLTIEDVPPKNMGGKKLLLTCRKCNSTSGHALDKHIGKRDRVRRFGNEEPGASVEGVMRPGGMHLGMDVTHGDEGAWLFMVDASNKRTHRDAVAALTETLNHKGSPLELHFDLLIGWDRRKARLALMRAAYLAAFAAFGYRYVEGHAELQRLRDQLQSPDTLLIPETVVRQREDANARGFLWPDPGGVVHAL